MFRPSSTRSGPVFGVRLPCPALRLPVIRNDPCGAEISHPCCWQVPLASVSTHLLSSCADTLSLVRTLTRYSARGHPRPHSDERVYVRIRGPRFAIAERVRHEAEGSHAVHRLLFTRLYAQATRQHVDYPQASHRAWNSGLPRNRPRA